MLKLSKPVMIIICTACLLAISSLVLGQTQESSLKGENTVLDPALPSLIPEPFPPLQGCTSGHFYTEPTFLGRKNDMAFVVWEEGVVCITTKTQSEGGWSYCSGPDCSWPGSDTSPTYCEPEERFYFVSSRPDPGKTELEFSQIWYVEREPGGEWGTQPMLLMKGEATVEAHSLSVTAKGDLVFDNREASLSGNGKLFRFELNGNQREKVSEMTVLATPHQSDGSPCISPDGNCIVFSSSRPGGYGERDLYAAFKNEKGTWGSPINLGSAINGKSEERYPRISPDGGILFFCREVYREPDDWDEFLQVMWVDMKVVTDLR